MFGLIPPQKSSNLPSKPGDSLTVELQSGRGYIQWRYRGFQKWNNLIPLQDLKGNPGKDGRNGTEGPSGPKGEQGIQGIAGKSGERGSPGNPGVPGLDGQDGKPGSDGREVELNKSATHIQWRYKGESSFRDLIPLSELKGPKGDRGETGEQGPKGAPGQRGNDGAQGPRGPMGYTGPAGPQGPPGGGEGGAVDSVNGQTGVVVLTKSDVGLSLADNTADIDKPISTAQQTGLNLKSNNSEVVHNTTDEEIGGIKTFTSAPVIPDEAYSSDWDGQLEPTTKNAVYDKIEALSASSLSQSQVLARSLGA